MTKYDLHFLSNNKQTGKLLQFFLKFFQTLIGEKSNTQGHSSYKGYSTAFMKVSLQTIIEALGTYE